MNSASSERKGSTSSNRPPSEVTYQNQNGQILLTVEQQHYLKRVLRLRTGDRFVVMDGRGSVWNAELQEDTAQASQKEENPRHAKMSMCSASRIFVLTIPASWVSTLQPRG